jgi:hypothetical protein
MSALISEPLRKLMDERTDQVTRERTTRNVKRMYVENSKRAAKKRGVQVDANLRSRAEAAAERALAPL